MERRSKAPANTVMQSRLRFQSLLARSRSTGDIYQNDTEQSDYQKFPETLSRQAMIRGSLVVPLHISPAAGPSPSNLRKTHPILLSSSGTAQNDTVKLPPCRLLSKPGNPFRQGKIQSRQNLRRFWEVVKPPSLQKSREVRSVSHPVRNTVARVAYRTKIGFKQGRPKPFNQDNFLILSDFNDTKHQKLVAVFDGHGIFSSGPYGHEVSAFIKSNLAWFVERIMDESNSSLTTLKSALKAGMQTLNQDLFTKIQIDTSCSGCTASVSIVRDHTVLTANVGDSRTVLGRKCEGGWQAVDLTVDHKPELHQEKVRIEKCGGRVEPIRGRGYVDSGTDAFVGPARVWLKQYRYPGLAMSRSFGDYIASKIGVICEPEISQYDCSAKDKFLVTATDGVWDVVTSQECVEIICPYWEAGDPDGACEALVTEATKRWRTSTSLPGDEVVDDITVVLLFLSM